MRLFFNIEQVEHKRLISLEGNEIDYDLLVLIPPHRGFPIIDASGIGDKGGWIPTDKETLLVKGQERIFAIGDTTDLPVSKSSAAAHFQAHSCPKLDSTCPREGTQCPPRWKRDVFCEGRREESEAYSFQLLKTSQTAPTVNLVLVAEGSHKPALFHPRPERHFSNNVFCNTSGQVRLKPRLSAVLN